MGVDFILSIRTGHTDIDALAQELSQILDIGFTAQMDMEEKFYESSDATTMEWMRLRPNYLEDDAGIPFESYEFVLHVWARYKDSSGYVESSQRFGERIFEILKQSQKYDLVLTRDAQKILLRYERPSPSEELP